MLSVGRRITLASLLLHLYPSAWRQRYEQEMLALLEQHTISFLTLLDLLFGALDAQLHSKDKKARLFFMFRNVRTTVITFVCAFIMYALVQTSVDMLPLSISNPSMVELPLSDIGFIGSLVLQLTLLMSNLMVAIFLLREQPLVRKKGRVLFGIACLIAIPLWPLVSQLVTLVLFPAIDPTAALHTLFPYLYILELIPSALLWVGVFVIVCIAKELLASQRKKLFSLTLGSYIIIPLILSCLLFFFTFYYDTYGAGIVKIDIFSLGMTSLLANIRSSLPYFMGGGALALTMSRKAMSRRIAFVPLIVATPLTLAMALRMASSLLFLILTLEDKIKPLPLRAPSPLIGLYWFNGLCLFIAVVFASVALVRWWALLLTTPPPSQESPSAVQA